MIFKLLLLQPTSLAMFSGCLLETEPGVGKMDHEGDYFFLNYSLENLQLENEINVSDT